MSSCKYSIRKAEHRWPADWKELAKISFTACSGRAVLSTIIALMPPVSAIKDALGLPLVAEFLFINFAIFVDPVKHIPSINLLVTSASPIIGPSPISNCNESLGTPASYINSTALMAIVGVKSAGLANTALPTDKAATICPVKIANGKFHGEIQTILPRGFDLDNFLASYE